LSSKPAASIGQTSRALAAAFVEIRQSLRMHSEAQSAGVRRLAGCRSSPAERNRTGSGDPELRMSSIAGTSSARTPAAVQRLRMHARRVGDDDEAEEGLHDPADSDQRLPLSG